MEKIFYRRRKKIILKNILTRRKPETNARHYMSISYD